MLPLPFSAVETIAVIWGQLKSSLTLYSPQGQEAGITYRDTTGSLGLLTGTQQNGLDNLHVHDRKARITYRASKRRLG